MSRHSRHLSQALAVAASSRHGRWQMGAVLVRAGNIVSAAPNAPRNPAWVVDGVGSSVHAEVAAMRRLKGPADGLTLYVARVSRCGLPRLARPCSECFTALLRVGLRRVYFTTGDGGYGTETFRPRM